ncbi:agamous-like MADS-box protein MADS9 [Wolffia australiana]
MGRGKIEIKRIENSTNRQVTFTKRKNGIIKKAKEISVLCNAQVYLVLFSSSGKMAEFCSDNTSLSRMLEQFHKYTGNRIWEPKHERLNAEIDRIKKENDAMQIELRRLKGEDIAPLSPYELIPLEATLQRGLDNVRAKQVEFLKKLKKNERLLEAENKELGMILEEHEASRGPRALQQYQHHHHHQHQQQLHHLQQTQESSYNLQTPFSFCGQPIGRGVDDGE